MGECADITRRPPACICAQSCERTARDCWFNSVFAGEYLFVTSHYGSHADYITGETYSSQRSTFDFADGDEVVEDEEIC